MNLELPSLACFLLVLEVCKVLAYTDNSSDINGILTSHSGGHTSTKDDRFLQQLSEPRSDVRRQQVFPESLPFPCDVRSGRSRPRPSSVHRLRPGDVDVIGAMGDSLVAGNGAMEDFALGTLIEHRGVSWCAGGEGTWRQFLTLPNILKEFNPNLRGYSTGRGEFLSPNAEFNVAFPVSEDADALQQAKYLVRKMKRHPSIDFQQDWKVITIFFGANNLCSVQCYNKERSTAEKHKRRLQLALDYLHENLPRTFVNLIPVLDVSVSVRLKRSIMCRILHTFFCQCFHFGRDTDKMATITQLVREYQKAEEELVSSGRYDTREDFTVVIQPFIKFFNAPLKKSEQLKEVIDISYITYDCFHFSQKGHALEGMVLWFKKLSFLLEEYKDASYTVTCQHPGSSFWCFQEGAGDSDDLESLSRLVGGAGLYVY
ncbi:phospholipase B1, membrane-associated-like isoform X1 [Anabrus simplex]|uniref:phospholipase B1, membrane-associated-like isoform X1 n=1 Tax=Anabrus simplex TaxID=316456 RepID=UPI0035A27DA5